jgi:hypothetical protein
MTTFLRLLHSDNKQQALINSCAGIRKGHSESSFDVSPDDFQDIPGAPFAYWVSPQVRKSFLRHKSLENCGASGRVGLQTSDDYRFMRLWWEVSHQLHVWPPHAKGGRRACYFSDVFLVVKWNNNGYEIKSFADLETGKIISYVRSEEFYFRPGITWTKSTTSDISFRCMPRAAIFGVSGLGLFVEGDSPSCLMQKLALLNSLPFRFLLSLSLGLAAEGRKHYEVGIVNKNPIPRLEDIDLQRLEHLAIRSYRKQYKLSVSAEVSRLFLLPWRLHPELREVNPDILSTQLEQLQAEIDEIAFSAYEFSECDKLAAAGTRVTAESVDDPEDEEEAAQAEMRPDIYSVLSWSIGVAFGRFDWRLATGEREAPPEPEPFDPLPAKSPGMLPDGDPPFHENEGILLDDPGHPHDLMRVAEEVLAQVDVPVPGELRRWLQRDFFPFHLQMYSKSRRKAPIYWPLSTASGSYTLWVYYPRLSAQTLYTAINDFVEPKLKQVGSDVSTLRNMGAARTREDEKQYEGLQAFELELIELRDTLLKIAPTYHPNQDDGVQITAAPLWMLFRHKPWQKLLKETWAKLEKGDYDWAHLSLHYWPQRVVRTAHKDRSIAIAHDLEESLWEEVEVEKKTKGGKVTKTKVWHPRELSAKQLDAIAEGIET